MISTQPRRVFIGNGQVTSTATPTCLAFQFNVCLIATMAAPCSICTARAVVPSRYFKLCNYVNKYSTFTLLFHTS